jgi:hypothetical protein
MREDQRFEIERAYDMLPHVVGASWACIWFRLNEIKKPTKDEFRQKVAEFFSVLERLVDTYPDEERYSEIKSYIKNRHSEEAQKILEGKNAEVEKRYARYVDYG